MIYLIDAWLDRPQPYLRILDRNTGAVCISLDGEALDELREQGDLDLQELSTNEPGVLKEQVRNLSFSAMPARCGLSSDCSARRATGYCAKPSASYLSGAAQPVEAAAVRERPAARHQTPTCCAAGCCRRPERHRPAR